MQNIAKLNNTDKAICVNTNPQSVLNGLNRNYSFIYDHNSKRYESHFEETEDDDFDSMREGYWGHIRDRNADRKQINIKSKHLNSYDGYWGVFKDSNTEIDKNGLMIPESNDDIYGSLKSNSPSMMSLSSSINSLSRFRENYMDDEESPFHKAASIFDKYEKKFNYDYNYKTSKLKIQACKRDEMKILMQSLEDQETNFKKEIIKSFDSNCLNINTNQNTSSSLTYSTQTKQINFLHFSNKSTENTDRSIANNNTSASNDNSRNNNLTNFKNVFNTLTKLKKTINIFNGDLLNLNRADLFLSFINNVHASMNDVDGFIFNYLYEKNQLNANSLNNSDIQSQRQTTNVSLCSNIYETVNLGNESKENIETLDEKGQKLFGNGNHSTMLFEYQNVKIGFMALVDNVVFEKLNTAIREKIKKNSMEDKDVCSSTVNNPIEYTDYITECDRLSKQLRLCGANVIIVLTNMDDQNEQRLVREASDLDIVFSSSQPDLTSSNDMKKTQIGKRWIIKSGTNFDCVSLVSLNLDSFNSNKILDIAITNYLIE